METKIIQVDPAEVEPDKIDIIARVVSSGGVMIYPTETFYGLGAHCFLTEALRRIFRLKERPAGRALPVIVSDMDMARSIIRSSPPIFEELASSCWPGPLTLILQAGAELPEELVGPERTIGIRLPAVPWLRHLVSRVAAPLSATSANISGKREIASPRRVIRLFSGRVELIVDGGKTPGRLPSTVLDLTSGKARLVREGAFPLDRLKKYLDKT